MCGFTDRWTALETRDPSRGPGGRVVTVSWGRHGDNTHAPQAAGGPSLPSRSCSAAETRLQRHRHDRRLSGRLVTTHSGLDVPRPLGGRARTCWSGRRLRQPSRGRWGTCRRSTCSRAPTAAWRRWRVRSRLPN